MLYENIVMAASFALHQHMDFSSDCALVKEVTNSNMKQLASERPRDLCWSATLLKASSSWEAEKLGVFKWRLNKPLVKCSSKSSLSYLSLFLCVCVLTAEEWMLADHDFLILFFCCFGLVLVLEAGTNGISVMKKSIFYSAGLQLFQFLWKLTGL